jgi:glycogen synthase
MRILHIAWEYPPLVYGGLGRHVGSLATAQAQAGHDVTVITQSLSEAQDDVGDGVRVIRVPRDLPEMELTESQLLAWVAGLETAFVRATTNLSHEWRPDVVHGHDWMIAHCVVTARQLFDRPLVATLHATEAGRHQGWLPNDLSRAIHSVEWWLAQESGRLIACSAHMRWEISRLFSVPESRVTVVPNGIDLDVWQTTPEAKSWARQKYAPDTPLLVFCGRLEWEKGLHTVLDAMPALRDQVTDIRLVIAGRGSKEDAMHRKVADLGLGDCVRFTGWLPEDELHALVATADVAVVPSLYEPFGLVALEAAALGTPVVVSRSGGLAEFAADGQVAATFPPGDPAGLSEAVVSVLQHPGLAERRAEIARRLLEDAYTWDRVALATERAYRTAIADWDAGVVLERAQGPIVQAGNLLTSGN